jgi:8-oxo-dGTP pyrophosphatase MutT (NUDIX family)
MKRDHLLSLLNTYEATGGAEHKMYLDTIEFIRSNPDCFERTLMQGHVTASGWVVSPDRNSVLLMHHRKLDRWFQPGGHCDGDPDVAAVAEKEVREETGVRNVRQVQSGIFDIDIHLIPANTREPAHFHYDIRFLFEADPTDPLFINFESKEVKWVGVADVEALNDSASIMRMVAKLTTSSLGS